MFVRFVLALLPILWLAVALSVWKRPAYQVCPLALALTVLLALFYWKSPGTEVLTGGLEGAVMALWPISLVIVAAVFTYNLTVRTGAMERIKGMLTAVTRDKRVLVLLIAWGFGGFMEGMAGFGTAVAIPAGILCGLGFDPIFSALVCLVANATPTAFGSIGIPTITAASVAGLEAGPTAVVVVLQLALMVVLTPLLMVMMTGGGVRALKRVWPVALGSGVAFVIPEFLTAKYVGAELPAVPNFSVATGSSEWQVVYEFCRYYGGIAPRFDRYGRLVIAPWPDGERRVLGPDAAVTRLTLRDQRYGVLSQVLVRDRTSEEVQTVADGDFLRRGGRSRRVLTMPGKSSYQAMRYTGQFQLDKSASQLQRLEITVAEPFAAWPGELVELRLAQNVGTGLWRVRESVSAQEERGSYTRLTLAPPDVLG